MRSEGDAVRGAVVAPQTVQLWADIGAIRLAGGPAVQARINAAVIRSYTENLGAGLTEIHVLYGACAGACVMCSERIDWALPDPSPDRLTAASILIRGQQKVCAVHIRCAPGRQLAQRVNARADKANVIAIGRARALERHGRSIQKARPVPAQTRLDKVGDRDDWICWLCERPVDPTLRGNDPARPTLDHIVPKSEGGGNGLTNLRLAHKRCNETRRSDPPDETRARYRARITQAEEDAEEHLDTAEILRLIGARR